MNDLIRGITKSKTMWANGGPAAALLYFWTAPELAGIPTEAKLVVLGVLLLNIILRAYTDQSLKDKGIKPPDTHQMQEIEKRMREVFRDEMAKSNTPTPTGEILERRTANGEKEDIEI